MHKILVLAVVAVILATGISFLVFAPTANLSDDGFEVAPFPILTGIDHLGNQHVVGTPGYTEWGKRISDEYQLSSEIDTIKSWNKVDPDIFSNGLILKSKVSPNIVSLIIYKPQMCEKRIFNADETEYIELCGNSEHSISCGKYEKGDELFFALSDDSRTKISDTCYAFSMFGVGKSATGFQTYMGTWFFDRAS